MDLRDTGEAKLIGLGWMCGLRGRIPALQLWSPKSTSPIPPKNLIGFDDITMLWRRMVEVKGGRPEVWGEEN
jgi:hypothetical protein